MKYFIARILLFSMPFILYVLLALYIDPYNILRTEHNPKLNKLKSEISYKLNYPLYKLKGYAVNPTDVILLGDSRVDKLKTEAFESLTKKTVTNLAYGGGTLTEVIETFWYVVGLHEVKEVYIGVSFFNYNETINMDRVSEAKEMTNSLPLYLFSSYCFKSTFLISKSLVTNEKIDIGVPFQNREEFWRYQLESSANNLYRGYKYSNKLSLRLAEVSKYCDSNNIKLVFFNPPSHTDLQLKVNEFKLESEKSRFSDDISNLGLFYDFDYSNNITENHDNFSDPFHYNDSIANIVVNEIVTGVVKHGRTYN
jgi:hypothetical protein